MSNKLKLGFQTLLTETVSSLPRNNYRQDSEFDETEILELGQRIITNGQKNPVGIAIRKNHNSEAWLCYGERRTRACVAASVENMSVNVFEVETDEEFFSIQMSENMDRKNTNAVSDGHLFKQLVDNGMSVLDISKKIEFPVGINTADKRVNYILNRIAFVSCHVSVVNAYLAGYIREFKDGDIQSSIFAKYPHNAQESVANYIVAQGKKLTNDEIEKIFVGFGINIKDALFDTIEIFNNKACEACFDFINGMCYNKSCFIERNNMLILIEQDKLEREMNAIGQAEPYYLINEEKLSAYEKEEEPVGSFLNVYGYVLSKKGASSHVRVGLVSANYKGWGNSRNYRGRMVYFCPISSKCPVHFSNDSINAEEKRIERSKVRIDNESAKQINALAKEEFLKKGHLIESADMSDWSGITRAYINLHGDNDARKLFCEVMKVDMDWIKWNAPKWNQWFLKTAKNDKEDFAKKCLAIFDTAFKVGYAINHMEELSSVLDINFEEAKKIADSNKKIMASRLEERNAFEQDKKEQITEVYLNASAQNVIFTDSSTILEYIKVDAQKANLCKVFGVKYKDVDTADLPIVADRIAAKFRELVVLKLLLCKVKESFDANDFERDDDDDFDEDYYEENEPAHTSGDLD